MKIAIPTAEGKLARHFGHCREFAFIEVNGCDASKKQMLEPPPHEPGVLPRWLHEQGVDVVIAGGMGARAVDLLSERGIKVVTGAPALSPEEIVTRYTSDTLETGANACDH
jgi:predicted Fe-Mo cluster-binding NifX family protein